MSNLLEGKHGKLIICKRCLELNEEVEIRVTNSEENRNNTCVNDLPKEILQYILSLIPPYKDLRHCKLVCKLWLSLIEDLIQRRSGRFIRSLQELGVSWQECAQNPWPVVAARYSHAACYYKDYLYVFGGSTNNNTTFNDLWKFDLGTRRWIRPLVTGTYPTPKACTTFVRYKNYLILFGGWNNPPFYNFDQSVRLNNQVHLYDVVNNNWIELDTSNAPNCVAGHSATVHNDHMIVFGGHRLLNNSNEIWVLDLKTFIWWKPEVSTPTPEPRFGQTQVTLDDNNVLIIGGCGGPNKIFSDVWLLSFKSIKDSLWTWKKLVVNNIELSASHVWSRTGCKVDNHVIFLGKYSDGKAVPMSSLARSIRFPQQNVGDNLSRSINYPYIKSELKSKLQIARCQKCRGVITDYSNNLSHYVSDSPVRPINIVRNTVMPSVKPNSMKNRQRQLEGCHRMEERIRHLSKATQSIDSTKQLQKDNSSPSTAVFLLDISRAVKDEEVQWSVIHGNAIMGTPPDTMFYSITYSETEIIVFGGIRKQTFFGPLDDNCNQLSNSVHILAHKVNAQ